MEETFESTSTIDETKQAYVNVLQFVTDNFYSDDNNKIRIELSSDGRDKNFYDKKRIVLSTQLIDAFGELNLPRFLVYYHELGHHLYSKGLFELIDVWSKQKGGPLEWKESYMHLVNWIEDFHIESKLKQEHAYLTDVINCIRKLPPDYDIKRLEYAFNYWYVNETPTPALQYTDQIIFKSYITRLLTLRDSSKTRFGQGVFSVLSIKQSNETKFALTLIEFYNWCVNIGIFPKDETLPKLKNPNNHLEPVPGNGDDQADAPDNNTTGDTDGDEDEDPSNASGKSNGKQGSHSKHSKEVGKHSIPSYEEVAPIKSPTTVFKDEIAQESKLINKELLDMSQRVQAEKGTLDGLFSTKYNDSTTIQPRVNVPNFFNPNKLADQTLFLEKGHTYMNVAIYRDISGSTGGETHTLMSHVCEQLYKDIPVDITYYLYSSGNVSIIEVPYVKWEDSDKEPKIYLSDPLYQQLSGGTNSDAIADVITQQLSDKWLNIIVTDGDLHALMARDNISALLKNVFVISVNSDLQDNLLGISIRKKEDLTRINSVLQTINIDR